MSDTKDMKLDELVKTLAQAYAELAADVQHYEELMRKKWGIKSHGPRVRKAMVEAEKLAKLFRKLSIEFERSI